MDLDQTINAAYTESLHGTRGGDRVRELETIRSYILSCRDICIPNHDDGKVTSINTVLKRFGIAAGRHLRIPTHACDISRMPALTKAQMALDVSDADLVIARGRLGVPGSGSMLVVLDQKGRILTASLSPPHVLHEMSVSDAVRAEMESALVRIGFSSPAGGR